ncbi:hypothetical protein FACS1894116_07810 [Betaproteobacteria bacterium]|nr:hypothetical protein FACS1894116_07810 [Betaproteobacteria bacterium]GHT97829.1 hypothetical protein FACS1894154_02070 [Betaproteobacteria bacterium]GHU30158.1 hypothetical protein FACS189497_09470 [Betaproteobacteria bacterium]
MATGPPGSHGRVHPELAATELFTDGECKGAYILDKKPIPTKPPTIRDVIRQIAKLGGFLGRKSDGEPGVKTLWLNGFGQVVPQNNWEYFIPIYPKCHLLND